MPLPRLPSRGARLLACASVVALAAALGWWRSQRPTAEHAQLATLAIATDVAGAKIDPAAPCNTDLDAAFTAIVTRVHASSSGDAALMSELETLADSPAKALAIGRRLMSEFPERAAEIGTILIGALVRASAHTAALELAQNGPEAHRVEWITLVLSHWVQSRPDEANLIVDVLREQGIGANIFAQVTQGWAASAPEQLARYATVLSPGEYRSIAFKAALDPWVLQNPAAVARWLSQLAEPSERDQALCCLVTRTDTAFRQTNQAILWAEAINNADLRRTALAQVIREWFGRDPGNAGNYLLTSPAFNPDQCQTLIASFTPPPEAL
jgi:hypothetical protein